MAKTSRKKILLPEPIGDEAEGLLAQRVDLLRSAGVDEMAVREAAAEADGIVLRSKARITEGVLAGAPRLKVVSRTGVGIDNIDVDACTRHGVMVCYLPGINAYAVAEHAMALMLALLRCLPMMDGAVRRGDWEIRNKNLLQDAAGKTLGILGLGRVGREVAARAGVFGMRVVGYDPYVKQVDGVEWAELDAVVACADVLTLHMPETPETRNTMDARRLALMKTTAYLINTSRGGVVDEAALAAALAGRKIAGAGLDVFANEPPYAGNPLFALDNVILTPHAAALTEQCGAAMMREAAAQALTALDGKTPPHVANADKLWRKQ